MEESVVSEYEALVADALLVAEPDDAHTRRLLHLRREMENDENLSAAEAAPLLRYIDGALNA